MEKIENIDDENKKRVILIFHEKILNKYRIIGEFSYFKNKPKFIFKIKNVYLEVVFEKENVIKWCHQKNPFKREEKIEESFNLEDEKLPENLTYFLDNILLQN